MKKYNSLHWHYPNQVMGRINSSQIAKLPPQYLKYLLYNFIKLLINIQYSTKLIFALNLKIFININFHLNKTLNHL